MHAHIIWSRQLNAPTNGLRMPLEHCFRNNDMQLAILFGDRLLKSFFLILLDSCTETTVSQDSSSSLCRCCRTTCGGRCGGGSAKLVHHAIKEGRFATFVCAFL